MKTYVVITLTLFLASCGQQPTSQSKSSRFQILRVDKNTDLGPTVYLLKDAETGTEYLYRSEWIQKLPAKVSPDLEKK